MNELIIDNKFGDELIAANERTIKDIGLNYMGFNTVLDASVGDGLMACNQRTFDLLNQKVDRTPVAVVREEFDEKPYMTEGEENECIRESLHALPKKEQIAVLKRMGVSGWSIRKFKTENQRVDKIMSLR